MLCATCRAEVPEGMKFCGQCGARLHTPQQPELRQLTVLFCDLVDSTALSGALDPEELREVTRDYHAVCERVIARHDGHVAQYLGDGLLVYFGHPMAHDDDAVRAVRTALGIHEGLADLAPRVRDRLGVDLEARIGVHTGPVVIGEMGSGSGRRSLAVGETTIVAHRALGVAEARSVVLTEATHAIVGGYFDCEPLGSHRLKGLSAPLRLYRAVRESGARTRLEVERRRGLTELTGRDEELAWLYARWRNAREGGVRAAVIGGEAGIGKSRLADALRRRVRGEAVRVLECSSSPYHRNSALRPVIALIERQLGIGPTTPPQERLEAVLERLGRRGLETPEARALVTRLLSIPDGEGQGDLGLSPEGMRELTLETLRDWLLRLAAEGPVLWLFEDLHWTDPTTLEFVGTVLAAQADVPLFIVLTHRPEFVPPWEDVDGVATLTVPRLDPESTRTLVERVTGKPLPEEVVAEVVDRAEGVPLFVEEVTKAVLETGLLEEQDDQYVLSGPLPNGLIPPTVQGSLHARLDRLGDAKAVAQVAATIGREFRYDVLRAVAGPDEDELRRHLERLIQTGLVFRDPSSSGERYLFKHALIQETAHQSLLRKARRELHGRIAEALGEIPEVAAEQPELLAQHWADAGRPDLAAPLWLEAGRRAAARAAAHEAIGHCRRGLEAVGALPEQERLAIELELVITMIPAIQTIAGWASPELRELLDRSRELVEVIGDPVHRLRVLAQSYAFHLVAGRCAESLELARRLRELGEASGQPALTFWGHGACSVSQLYTGRIAEGLASADAALGCLTPEGDAYIQQVGGLSGFVYARCYRSEALWMLGYPDRARAASEESVAIARELGHVPSLAFALGYSTEFYPLLRDPRRVIKAVEETFRVEEHRRSTFWKPLVSVYRGWALTKLGRAEEGIELMRDSIAAYRAAGSGLTQVHMLGRLAEGLIGVGRWDEGLEILTEAMLVVEQMEERYFEPELYRLRAEALRARAAVASDSATDRAEAEANARAALAIARRQQAKSLELRAAMTLVRLQRELGDASEGRADLAAVHGWFEEGFQTPDLRDAAALLRELPEGDAGG